VIKIPVVKWKIHLCKICPHLVKAKRCPPLIKAQYLLPSLFLGLTANEHWSDGSFHRILHTSTHTHGHPSVSMLTRSIVSYFSFILSPFSMARRKSNTLTMKSSTCTSTWVSLSEPLPLSLMQALVNPEVWLESFHGNQLISWEKQ
jgi:hypothetical protein